MISELMKQNFLARIVKNSKNNDCWHFKSRDNKKFCNDFNFEKQRFKPRRFAFLLFKENIPQNLKVINKCGDYLCINPDHHFLGDTSDMLALAFKNGKFKSRKGIKRPEHVIKRISEAHKGKIIPIEMREYLRKINLGKKHSEATKRKMTENRMGIAVPDQARIKIAFSKQGEKNYNTKLTAEQIYQIRKLQTKQTIAKTATQFGISNIHVINIWRRKVWKHLK